MWGLLFCWIMKFCSCGGDAWQPQRTEPCQCEWPALGIQWATARSNAASAVPNRCGRSCTGCSSWTEQVVCGGCGFVRFWSFPVMEAVFVNQCAQSPASVYTHCWACHGALQSQLQPLQCSAGVVEPALGAVAAGLGRWHLGVAVLPDSGLH